MDCAESFNVQRQFYFETNLNRLSCWGLETVAAMTLLCHDKLYNVEKQINAAYHINSHLLLHQYSNTHNVDNLYMSQCI